MFHKRRRLWTRIRRWLAAGTTTAALACGPHATITGVLDLPRTAPLRVVSYNVYWDNAGDKPNLWELRREQVLGTLRGIDADIIGLQEPLTRGGAPFDQAADLMHGLEGYEPVVRVTKSEPGYTVYDSMMLYRRDRFDLLEVDHFWLSTTPDAPFTDDLPRPEGVQTYGPRTVTCIVLHDRQLDIDLVACNTHWDGVPMLIDASARLVVDRLSSRYPGMPWLLMGDFNSLPYLPDGWPTQPSWAPGARNMGYQTLLEAGFIDGYAETHPVGSRTPSICGWEPSCPTHGIDIRIDWVLHTPELRTVTSTIVETWDGGRRASDHMPVVDNLEPVR